MPAVSATSLAHTFNHFTLADTTASSSNSNGGVGVGVGNDSLYSSFTSNIHHFPVDAPTVAPPAVALTSLPLLSAFMTPLPPTPSSSSFHDNAHFTHLVSLVAAAAAAVVASTNGANSMHTTPVMTSRCNSQDVLGAPGDTTAFAGYGMQVSVERGVKTFSDLPGAELYLYHDNETGAQNVFCRRTQFITDWGDMLGMAQVRRRLEEMILPGLASASAAAATAAHDPTKTLFIHGLPQSGIATALHLFCRQHAINLLDFHLSSPLRDGYEWRLITLLKQHQPCVLLMHRFDTLWDDTYRFNKMAALRDGWTSVERQSFLQCWLVWAMATPDVTRIMPLYQTATPPHVPVAVELDAIDSADGLAGFGRMLLRKRGLLPEEGSDGAYMPTTTYNTGEDSQNRTAERQQAIAYLENEICRNTHVLCVPGRMACLIDKAIALATNSPRHNSEPFTPSLSSSSSSSSPPPSSSTFISGTTRRPHITVKALKTAYETVAQTSLRLVTGLPQ